MLPASRASSVWTHPRPSPVGAIAVTGLPLANGQLNVYIDRTGRVLDVSAPADFAVRLSDV